MKSNKKRLPADSALRYPASAHVKASRTPTRDEIAARAYWIWVELGYPAGRDLEHWLQAERELLDGNNIELPKDPDDLEDDAQLKNPAERRIDEMIDVEPPKRSSTSL